MLSKRDQTRRRLLNLLGFFLVFQLSSHLSAEERTLILAVPAEIPPYYTPDGNGILPDIMRQALAPYNYKIATKPMGNMRMTRSLQNGDIDIAPYTIGEVANAYESVKYLTFFNVVVTKRSRNIHIRSVSDLKGLKIAAFQGAREVLGNEYRTIVSARDMYYKEMSDQKNQMSVFWNDRVDAVILGKRIFDYRSFHDSPPGRSPADVTYHPIFGDGTAFSAVFSDKTVRDHFDNGYKKLVESKRLNSIYSRYETW
jgi:polar amino acid transport system substrate-binding protein